MKCCLGCEEYKDDKKIVLSENRSKLTFFNPKRDKIRIIKVDGCAIVDNKTLRCDYLLVPTNKVEIYVELKGSKIKHAVEQIESTIKLLSYNPQKIKKLCFVVSTRVPKLTTTIQQLKIKFSKHYNASLIVNNTPDTYDLSQITINKKSR